MHNHNIRTKNHPTTSTSNYTKAQNLGRLPTGHSSQSHSMKDYSVKVLQLSNKETSRKAEKDVIITEIFSLSSKRVKTN